MKAKSTVENGENCENHNLGIAVDVPEEDEEILKRRILSHPLFGLLMETHLNCLKVALVEPGEVLATTHAANQANLNPEATIPSSSEVDRFMEAYSIALSKLKEAMQGPQQESASFIDSMYVQLKELSVANPNNAEFNSPN